MKPVLTTGGGMCAAFPDVCKTPTPAGPTPIPYPNIIQCTDGSGSSKVRILNKETLRKSDTFRMSSGDEAGTAGGGIVSNRIKGQGEIKAGCSTVKVEGRDIAYLLVSVGQNGGCGKTAPSGKAVKPGQTKTVLRTVRGKKRKVIVKVKKYKDDPATKAPPNTSVRNAADKLGKATSEQAKIKASEALGDAGARNAMKEVAKQFGGLTSGPISFSGSGVVDVIGMTAKGIVLVFEAKGGGSSLGYRMAEGVGRCRQGTPQYLKDIAKNMMKSKDPATKKAGQDLMKAIKNKQAKYYEARTKYKGKPPKPKATTVKEFDPE